MNSLRLGIKKDVQIKKFCLYGFLKNLKFFEPYLLIYLMSNNISLLQIGLLYSIREIIVNVFEVPSGIIADCFGKKKELSLCFIFYIISFIFFFLCDGFFLAAVAMIFYGLGEAFRSGTHKAMIYSYLDYKGWENEKTFVYGRTRSYSLLGSTISSLLAIVIILNIPSSGYIFLIATIPYILDFILILSYPDIVDKEKNKKEVKLSVIFKMLKESLIDNKHLRKMLLNDGLFAAIISTIKDFIQPIMEIIFITSGILFFVDLTPDENLKIILGVVYAAMNLFSALASKRSYLLSQKFESEYLLNVLYIVLGISLAFLGFIIKEPVLVFIIYFIIYLILNIRKPIYVSTLDNHMKNNQRATMLSIGSQLKSIFIIILAPIVGYIADSGGINMVMYLLAILVFVSFPFVNLNIIKKSS
jgi:hypothetical protein